MRTLPHLGRPFWKPRSKNSACQAETQAKTLQTLWQSRDSSGIRRTASHHQAGPTLTRVTSLTAQKSGGHCISRCHSAIALSFRRVFLANWLETAHRMISKTQPCFGIHPVAGSSIFSFFLPGPTGITLESATPLTTADGGECEHQWHAGDKATSCNPCTAQARMYASDTHMLLSHSAGDNGGWDKTHRVCGWNYNLGNLAPGGGKRSPGKRKEQGRDTRLVLRRHVREQNNNTNTTNTGLGTKETIFLSSQTRNRHFLRLLESRTTRANSFRKVSSSCLKTWHRWSGTSCRHFVRK